MKYNTNNKPIVCMQTNSTCYKSTYKMAVKGVLWHSTGANNPWIKRYVQPSDNAPDRAEMLELIGKNAYGNDWNHINHQVGLNAWIGKLADGTVATVQTMPWDYRPWGCGGGSKGSCNNGFVQFEICEDNLNNKDYFNKIYKEACELTAYICTIYNLDPYGTVNMNGVKAPVILCHKDSANLGLGSNHGDIYHWFSKYGKDMDDVRNDVATLMKKTANADTTTTPSTTTTPEVSVSSLKFEVGDIVNFAGGKHYTSPNAANGSAVKASRAKVTSVTKNGKHPYHLRAVNDNGVFISGGVYGFVDANTVSTVTSSTSNTSSNKIDTVKEVQSWANKNYQSGLVVDGIYGAATKKALVKILQTELNQAYNTKLVVDGIWGEKTRNACPTLRKGAKNDVVKVLQALLVCNGYSRAYVDGDYGSGTYDAVKSYQSKQGLAIDGIAGKNTFAELCG